MTPLLADRPYLLVCAALGLGLGWVPSQLHGPIPHKFDVLFIEGRVAVWGWYVARSSIGFWIGATSWPRAWWLRGPLVGALVLLPLTLVSLAMPACGAPCMRANLGTAAALGFVEAGVAWWLTGLHRRLDGAAR
ncbi:MAG TPA: hypothetical protein VMW35_08715 [Myxococcota bacterium]|jgi:hypothetical protein|nr:hypothetical protein [Myxococcota bacterium]